MRLTESSNSVKISRHTKFRDIFLIFKGLGIIWIKHREKALQQKHKIRNQDLLYSANQNLSPPSFHCLDCYPPNLSCRPFPPSWESIKRTHVDPGGSTCGMASCWLKATDQHDAWPSLQYGNL